jgi:hypothetical protein
VLQNPEKVILGMRGMRHAAERQYSTLIERMALIVKRLDEDEAKLARLLDLYLDGQFDRDALLKRKLELEKQIADLKAEQASLREHLEAVIPSEEQIASLEAMCAEIRMGLENATFEDKKRYFEMLDVRGAVAYEDGKEVIYTTCRLGQQQVLQTRISPSSNTGETWTMRFDCPSPAPSP